MLERDAIGELYVDDNVYYGINAERNKQLRVSNYQLMQTSKEYVHYFFKFKKAAASANLQLDALPKEYHDAIHQALDECLEGQFDQYFVVDPIQGNGDVALNMNINEVVAKRASEILTGDKNSGLIAANDHVSCNYSTTDIGLTAIRLACYDKLEQFERRLEYFSNALGDLTTKYCDDVKLARPVMRDSLPITFGQVFGAMQANIDRLLKQVPAIKDNLLVVPIGATMFGSGIGSIRGFKQGCLDELGKLSDKSLREPENMFDIVQNQDDMLTVANFQASASSCIQKMVRDIRLFCSGPKSGFNELFYQPVTPGSSIMPGKTNPVIEELVIMVNMKVLANQQLAILAVSEGELECNPWTGMMGLGIFESFQLMDNAYRIFSDKILATLDVNREQCQYYTESSLGYAVMLSSIFGYKKASEVSLLSKANDVSICQTVIEQGLMEESDAKHYFEPINFTSEERYYSVLEMAQAKYGKRNFG